MTGEPRSFSGPSPWSLIPLSPSRSCYGSWNWFQRTSGNDGQGGSRMAGIVITPRPVREISIF